VRHRLEKPLVYLISDGTINDSNYDRKSAGLLEIVNHAVSLHIPLIQIREKRISARRLYELTYSALKLTRSSNTRILVNDRLDIAFAANANGVHLTSKSVRPNLVREFANNEFLIGVSTHCPDDIALASEYGADFVVFGPVFDSPGKGSAIGIEKFAEAVSSNPKLPVLGLGGINESNYPDVLAAGGAGFAAIRFLNDFQNLEKVSAHLGL
jgi:thiamine-phosphate pyrophosphorylase